MRSLVWFAIAALSGGTLSAQKTWVVDAGGGGDFRTLAAAFGAANHGDTLRVRSGSYAGAATSKGLRVLGDPGATLSVRSLTATPLRITNLPASQTFVLRGFRASVFGLVDTVVIASGCSGAVVIEECSFDLPTTITRASLQSMLISTCDKVTLRGVTMRPGIVTNSSNINVSSSAIDGLPSYRVPLSSITFRPTIGLVMTGGTVAIANSRVTGGAKGFADLTFQPLHAVDASSSNIVVAGLSKVASGRTDIPAFIGRSGSNNLLYDLRATISGAIQGFTNVHRTSLATTSVTRSGSNASVTLDGPAGRPVVLLLSVAARPILIPGIGQLWLDVSQLLVVGAGAFDNAGKLVLPLPLPTGAGLSGLPAYLQGLIVMSPTTLELASSTVVTIR